MKDAAVIPDGLQTLAEEACIAMGLRGTLPGHTDVVLILPLEPDLGVVVLVDQLQEPAQQMLALCLRHAIDMFHVGANGEDGLPASDRVCTNDWVDCLELGTHIQGTAARLLVQLEAASCRRIVEPGLCECCGQGLEELLVGSRDSVVDLVA